MKVTVTGAAGFIGSRLVTHLAAAGHDVTALVRRTAGSSALTGVRIALGDVRDPDVVAGAVHGAEVVIHLARAKGHGVTPRREVASVNAGGTDVVARACAAAGARVLVHASSTAVYGRRCPFPVTEDEPLRPDSPYARSKAEAERLAMRQARDGFAVVIARIPAVMGPGARSWLPLVSAVQAHRLAQVGPGTNWHHVVDVDDLVDGLVRCGRPGVPGGAYNLAGPEPVPLRVLLAHVAQVVGARRPRSVPAVPVLAYVALGGVADRVLGVELPRIAGARFLTSDRRLDLTRAAATLGFRPSIGVLATVRRTIEWLSENGLLPGKVRSA